MLGSGKNLLGYGAGQKCTGHHTFFASNVTRGSTLFSIFLYGTWTFLQPILERGIIFFFSQGYKLVHTGYGLILGLLQYGARVFLHFCPESLTNENIPIFVEIKF